LAKLPSSSQSTGSRGRRIEWAAAGSLLVSLAKGTASGLAGSMCGITIGLAYQSPSWELPHPSYPLQLHTMTVYETRTSGTSIRCAAGELSATSGDSMCRNERSPTTSPLAPATKMTSLLPPPSRQTVYRFSKDQNCSVGDDPNVEAPVRFHPASLLSSRNLTNKSRRSS
jgi:hypothetical protein